MLYDAAILKVGALQLLVLEIAYRFDDLEKELDFRLSVSKI